MVLGQIAITSRTRARSWYAKCGVAGPTRASMSSMGRLRHRPASLTSSVGRMRRPTTVELMLLSAIVLWALNITFTRYILTHGFQPLAYSTVRYGLAVARVRRDRPRGRAHAADRAARHRRSSCAAASALWLNQIGFVYSVKTTTASVVALMIGATPIFAALLGLALGTESLSARFWLGAAPLVRRRRARRGRHRRAS